MATRVTIRRKIESSPAKARSARFPSRDEHRDFARRLRLVFRVRRELGHRPLPPLRVLVAANLANLDVKGFRSVLERDVVWIRDEVVIPLGIIRRTAFGGNEGILSVVFDAHDRGL